MQMDSSLRASLESSSSDEAERTRQSAIVVANSKYDADAFKLLDPEIQWAGNPSFDARQMLRKLGLRRYEVNDYYDLSGAALRRTLSDFVAAFHERQLEKGAEKEARFNPLYTWKCTRRRTHLQRQ